MMSNRDSPRFRPAIVPQVGSVVRVSALIVTVLVLAVNATTARAAIAYTCNADVSAGTCSALNSTVAGLYNSTFSNATANIYIEYGATNLGQSTTGFYNTIPYSTYVTDLTAEQGAGSVRAAALASLPQSEPSLYGTGTISITSALGTALGLTGLYGTTASGGFCIIGTSNCYNGIITITNSASTPLYYRSGAEAGNAYDFYSVVEHETDEVLGTGSCISTQGANLSNPCTAAGATASASDLYRYSGSNSRVLMSTTPGAYFSYDGGKTNGADGFVYNTAPNYADYADFVSTCSGPLSVQDAYACPGTSGLDITNDGGAEINILNAVGFDLLVVPEPAGLAVITAGVFGLIGARVRARRVRNG